MSGLTFHHHEAKLHAQKAADLLREAEAELHASEALFALADAEGEAGKWRSSASHIHGIRERTGRAWADVSGLARF